MAREGPLNERRTVLALAMLSAAVLRAQPIAAFDTACEMYRTCCLALVGAYQEAGVPASRVRDFEATCFLEEALAGMPAAQEMFCAEAWEAVSRESFQHFLEGRIGFYPQSCREDPLQDPEEILEPDPDAEPEPGPEEEPSE